MTSIYGTGGAILLGVPVGFFTSVYLAKIASPKVRGVIETAVSLLAGIPSVVYGLVGMLILVPGIRKLFNVPDGASLLAAIIVLAIMILPSIIKVSLNALEQCQRNMRMHHLHLVRQILRHILRCQFRLQEVVSQQQLY